MGNIKYPFFENVSRDEAVAKLAAMPGAGHLLFRPSSRGLSYLSMTWKMADNPDIFVNLLIEEKEKPNPYAIGRKLVIDKETYDDLDEVYTMHRPRINALTQRMVQHKNFRYGTETDIVEMLKENQTGYALSYSYQRPGHFLLSYIYGGDKNREKRVTTEFVGLTYTGYRFRKLYFDVPGKLINWFKQNFKKNHPKYARRDRRLKDQRRAEQQQKSAYLNVRSSSAQQPPPPAPHVPLPQQGGPAAYMHPARQMQLNGGAPPIAPGGSSLNDDVMFNNNGGGGGYHQPPPPQHHPNGHHNGHGGYYQQGQNGHNNQHHNGHHGGGNGHRRQRSSSRSRGPPYGSGGGGY